MDNGTRKYAFTWVPDPKKFKGIKPIFQFNDLVPYLNLMRKSCDYIIYPELTIAGNMHFHGKISIRDKKKYYTQTLPSLKYNGFICLKKEPNEVWDNYIKKDASDMQEILGIPLPLVYVWEKKTKKAVSRQHNLDDIKSEAVCVRAQKNDDVEMEDCEIGSSE